MVVTRFDGDGVGVVVLGGAAAVAASATDAACSAAGAPRSPLPPSPFGTLAAVEAEASCEEDVVAPAIVATTPGVAAVASSAAVGAIPVLASMTSRCAKYRDTSLGSPAVLAAVAL